MQAKDSTNTKPYFVTIINFPFLGYFNTSPFIVHHETTLIISITHLYFLGPSFCYRKSIIPDLRVSDELTDITYLLAQKHRTRLNDGYRDDLLCHNGIQPSYVTHLFLKRQRLIPTIQNIQHSFFNPIFTRHSPRSRALSQLGISP